MCSRGVAGTCGTTRDGYVINMELFELHAIEIARSIHNEARETVGKAEQEALSRWAIQSQNKNKIESMISLARSYLATDPEEFDDEPWLFCAQNGTIDLRTGILGPFDRDHLITKQGGVPYDHTAKCPRWLEFLDRVMMGDQEVVAFLKRTVGYTLTADSSEQCFFILHGEGANGKSTFIEVIRGLLGDYGRPTEFKTLIDGRVDGVRNDLAALCGLRLVTSVESNPGRRFDEALIKQLTGGDKITARLLYQEFFDFHPTFKLMLAVNHKPEIRGVDEGIWRRVRLIPFDVTIPSQERIKNLAGKLLAEEGAGILRWAVEGCSEWLRDGLGLPEQVRLATESYREESDALKPFLEACCVIDRANTDLKVSAAALYQRYNDWCLDSGEEPWKKTTFGRAMGQRGFTARNERFEDQTQRIYRGVVVVGTSQPKRPWRGDEPPFPDEPPPF